MKTRNVNLDNTPLLINNICKYIILEAPTKAELIKKVKEYEILLAKALTNKYKLTHLLLDNNGQYNLLSNGNYKASILLNFSGFAKSEITNPEKTLQIVKHLTALESKQRGTSSVVTKQSNKKTMKSCSKSELIPVKINPGMNIDEAISAKQAQVLEQLIKKTNLKDISFFISKKPVTSIKIMYKYEEEINKIEEQSDYIER